VRERKREAFLLSPLTLSPNSPPYSTHAHALTREVILHVFLSGSWVTELVNSGQKDLTNLRTINTQLRCRKEDNKQFIIFYQQKCTM